MLDVKFDTVIYTFIYIHNIIGLMGSKSSGDPLAPILRLLGHIRVFGVGGVLLEGAPVKPMIRGSNLEFFIWPTWDTCNLGGLTVSVSTFIHASWSDLPYIAVASWFKCTST